jgi:acetyltransferase-like isoleucine patch superfamily enzyme
MIVSAIRRARRVRADLLFMGRLHAPSSFVIGPRVRVARSATLQAGERVSIGADCTVMAHVELGQDVMVSSSVAFIGDDHPFQGLPGPITEHAARPLAKVVVEGDTLIGFGAILIGPLTVGRGAVVAAGAVVTADLAPDTVYGGVPARPIGRRSRGRSDDHAGVDD